MAGLVPFNKKNRNTGSLSKKNSLNIIDDFFDDAFNNFSLLSRSLTDDSFKIDVREKNHEYLVEVELPGVKKEDINLNLDDDGRLTIAVNKKEDMESKSDDNKYIHRERRYESMQRTLYLANAKADEVNARLEDGLLEITVAKEEQSERSRQIEIE